MALIEILIKSVVQCAARYVQQAGSEKEPTQFRPWRDGIFLDGSDSVQIRRQGVAIDGPRGQAVRPDRGKVRDPSEGEQILEYCHELVGSQAAFVQFGKSPLVLANDLFHHVARAQGGRKHFPSIGFHFKMST